MIIEQFLFYFIRQEALLAAISEKDANIALLELSASKKKKTQEEVMALKREKDRLVHQLKQQVGRDSFSYFQGNRKLALFSFVLFYSNLILKVFKPGLTCDSSYER